MRRSFILILILVAMFMLAGCSQLQCWSGSCKEISNVAELTALVATDEAATESDMVDQLSNVANYYSDLLDNSKPFGGLYANAKYKDILTRSVALSADIARRAEAGSLSKEQMVTALKKSAFHLTQLKLGTVGEQ